ncbi:hypothetical protein SPBR_05611 [Sporothrix brasiliensis 5110]|uniref:Arrestin-like N-terminal domain-containing protein n=1 Tax=Sporothrix brasiliensis 5110 TaxID=1398154 RepID=A0A0C2FTY4_9PEZI|nr:uncharacterized protein SPBR_05611 [Sporothrix brasiliensis 5110]KIH94483.1 hypothetical protein SPBR_05611 [Sporothrix brasiliensis 5110]
MSVHIHLVDQPEYYTNLDIIHGEVKFFLSKPDAIGAVVVKLEGESSTSLTVPPVEDEEGWTYMNEPLHDLDPSRNPSGTITRPAPGTVVQENHKILYQVAQVHPLKTDEPLTSNTLPAGQHTFPFRFKVPFNNACADPVALSRTGGMVDVDGNAENPNGGPLRFGVGNNGIRIMDGTKQLMYTHVKQTLPPSFAGYLSTTETTEIRYFVKATVQRPGMFRGNWRNSVGFKFLPIEPIRPPPSTREMFARRPFTFRDRAPPSDAPLLRNSKKKTSFFRNNSSSTLSLPDSQAGASVSPTSPSSSLSTSPNTLKFPVNVACRDGVTPSIQLIALLPFPAILTCNEPLPLRIVARKLEASREQVYLTSLDIRLLGRTRVKGQDVEQTKTATWIIMTRLGLTIPVCDPDAPVDSELELPDDMWRHNALPNTVMPGFVTCNISRDYQLEVRAGLCWSVLPIDSGPPLASESLTDQPSSGQLSKKELKEQLKEQKKEQKAAMKAMKVMKPRPAHLLPQTIILPLTFHSVQVYSGIKPNKMLIDAVERHRQNALMRQQQMRREGRPSLPDTRLHQPFQHQLHQNPYPNVDPSQPPTPHPPPPQEVDRPVFELSSDPVPAPALAPTVAPRPNGSAYVAPQSPSPSTTPSVPPPSVPGAVEVSGLPVIRRRPVPQNFAAQQREEQQQRQNREKFPSGEDPASAQSHAIGRMHGSVSWHGPNQQFHMRRRQTSVDPLYPPQLRPGEEPASMLPTARSSSTGSALTPTSSGGASGGIVAQNGDVLVTYNGIVSSMAPSVASAINAFAFTDGDTASIYQEPPPSYDEAMADTAAAMGLNDNDSGGAAMRPAFSGEANAITMPSSS